MFESKHGGVTVAHTHTSHVARLKLARCERNSWTTIEEVAKKKNTSEFVALALIKWLQSTHHFKHIQVTANKKHNIIFNHVDMQKDTIIELKLHSN